MPDLREVELRIAVAEGLLSRPEADLLGEEARRKQQSPLALLVQRGRVSEESYQSLFAAALNDPAWRAEGQEGSASTFTMTAPPPASDEPPFPVAAWDRYSNVRFLGQGGMGKVYLAVDTRLRREVAIKFVRGDDAEHVRRLIAEARTQARVNHERICKVYEVDEVEGKVYIAMQYIHGKPLGRCAAELTLEQKVMLVRGAAEGIHEAHSRGIIHRDIKPSNIMIERSDDGELRPYVMDFGLAHSAQEAGATQTGTVLGTPRYMAPEQAHGSAAKLDRRADVYSLGATLYHLVTGEPPVPGETIAEVIHNLVTIEPRPLRGIDPNIPIDLEAIVLKCLEKERSARYDSARALADDLGRFLNGEPVIARPADVWYRLRKRIAKHRRLVAASAVALVVLAVAIGWAIQSRSAAVDRERFAQHFTERVEGIEAMARYSALSPLHDIRGDRGALRAQMSALEAEIQEAGDIAAGPGHYALGRGYLALDDDDQARAQLAAAWRDGYREPRVAFALGEALGHLYQQGLRAAERIQDKEQRDAKIREVETAYRAPARAYLVEGRAAGVVSPNYVAALVAFYDDRLDDALSQLDAIGDSRSWFYEVRALRGDILLARGTRLRDGGDRDRAERDFAASRAAYAAAAAIGRSVPSIYKSLGDLEHAALRMAFYGQGDVMAAANRAFAAIDQALTAVPDHYDTLVLEAYVRRSVAEHLTEHGGDVGDLLPKALAAAQRAVKAAPARSDARLEMAQTYRQWGDFRMNRHEDPSAQLREAIAISDAIPPTDRDATYYGNLGLAYSVWGDYQADNHGDAAANYDKAIDAFGKAVQYAEARRSGQLGAIYNNLGITLFKRASQRQGKDSDGDLRGAIAAFDNARRLIPGHPAPCLAQGQALEIVAQHARARGDDPGPDLERALAAYRAGLATNPSFSLLYNGVGSVLQARASVAWEHGEQPEPLLDDAQHAFEQAIEAAPDQSYGYDNVGEVLLQRAGYQRARDEDPRPSVAAAVKRLDEAIKRDPNYSTFSADLGMAHAIAAAYELEHGIDPVASLELARKAIRAAIKKNGSDPQAQLYTAEILGLQARLDARHGRGKSDDFRAAADAFHKALGLAPDNQDYPIAFAQFCRAWAAFERDPGEMLDSGLEAVNQVLTPRPAIPDALVVRASLALMRAQREADGAARRTHAASAADDFARALRGNPALERVWAAEAAQAQRLAAP